MANEIRAAFNAVYADGPSTEPAMPPKPDIRNIVGGTLQSQHDALAANLTTQTGDLQTQINALEEEVDTLASSIEGAAEGYVVAATWTALAAITGTRAGQPGRVALTDAGTHTDPVVGGTVPNTGEYAWSTSPAGWRRIGDVIDAQSLRDDINAEKMIFLVANGQIVYDPFTRTLLVPAVFGQRYNGAVWNLAPLTGDNFRRITESSSSAVVVYVDVADLIANGSTSPTALKLDTTYPSTLSQGNDDIVVLGHIYQQKWFPNDRVKLGRIVANECGYSKDDNDLADLKLTQFVVPADLTNATAIGDGFTRGWKATEGTGLYFGGRFKEPIRRGYVFYRFRLEADADNTFGTPRIVIASPAITTGNLIFNATLERTVNSRYRVYSGFIKLDQASDYVGCFCGSTNNDGTVRAFGLQFAVIPDETGVVLEGDMPRAANLVGNRLRALEDAVAIGTSLDLLFPKNLAFIKERGYPLFLDQLFPSKAGPYSIAAASRPVDNSRPLDVKSTDGMLDIDPARVGTEMQVSVFNRTSYKATGSQIIVGTTVKSLDDVAALAPKVHFIGDSLTDITGTATQTALRLKSMTGVDATFIGTTPCNEPDTSFFVLGEGRQSAEFADFIYQHTDFLDPLPPGQEATYLAGDKTFKRGYSPYLRAATGGDDPAKVFNGYIFDMEFYLDRFGLADPDVVVINLGTNDISQQDAATSLAQIQTGLNVMVPQIRAALPNVYILIVWNSLGPAEGDDRWNTEHRAGLGAVIKFVKDLGDAKVLMVPIYATVSRDNGFPWAAGTPNADTGISSITLSDGIHYGKYGIAQYGDVVAQFVLALLA